LTTLTIQQTKSDSFLLGLSFSLRLVVVCHCYRFDGGVIRIISARKATAHETKHYKKR